jgi:hypothetical protein
MIYPVGIDLKPTGDGGQVERLAGAVVQISCCTIRAAKL